MRDWSDERETLRNWGLTTTVGYTSSLVSNLSGGSNQALDYTGQLSASLDFDLEKLWKARGLSFQVNGTWGTGGNLSATIGNLMTVSELYAPDYYLGEMYLEQRLMDGKLTLDAGRLAPGMTFAFLPVYGNYLNSAFNPNPIALSLNDVTYSPLPPGTQWGAQALYHPTENIELMSGVFNTNPNSAAGARHGCDFNIAEGNKGALWTAQVNFLRNPRRKERKKPGQYSLGGFYNTNYFHSVSNNGAGSNYTFEVNRAINIGGNFQYILKPGGYPAPSAAVFGVVLGVTF